MERFEINAMTFGPYGVGELGGKKVLTPGVVTGDLVEAEVTTERRDYTLARAPRVLRGGKDRREPPCEYLPRCGGCGWQHIAYPAQVRIKGELLAAEFRRAFGCALEPHGLVAAAPAEFGYRARVRLKVGPGGALGYQELASNRLVSIERCMIAAPEIEAAAAMARAMGPRSVEIEIVASARGQVLIVHLSRAPGAVLLEAASAIVRADPRIAGAIIRGGAERHEIADVAVVVEPELGCEIRAAADCFTQVNHPLNTQLVATVMEFARIEEHSAVLDLFCGTGNFSLPAARRGAKVIGVDAEALAIAAARENAARMNLRAVQFVAMRADATAHFLQRAKHRPHAVILDPPRAGAAGLMETIARLKAGVVIYVSCDPATLTRDLRILVAAGYQIGRVRGFDFFPQTHHLEAVVELLLT
jgi:23S rRNA (uracil1939-C5)-methyltransferase